MDDEVDLQAQTAQRGADAVHEKAAIVVQQLDDAAVRPGGPRVDLWLAWGAGLGEAPHLERGFGERLR